MHTRPHVSARPEPEPDVSISAQADEIRYGIGQDHGGGSFGMWHGPFEKERDCLEIPGRDNYSVIVKLTGSKGNDEILWRWDGVCDCWRKAEDV